MAKGKRPKNTEDGFRDFLRGVSFSTQRDQISSDYKLLGDSKNIPYFELNWSSQYYENAIKFFSKSIPNASSKTIGNILQNETHKLFAQQIEEKNIAFNVDTSLDSILPLLNEEAIIAKYGEIVELLQGKINDYQVLVPISGVELLIETDQLNFGRHALYISSSEHLKTIFESIKDKQLKIRLEEAFQECSCYFAIENVTGDANFANDHALKIAQDFVHLLNFLISSSRDRVMGWHKIGILGDPTVSRDRVIVIYSDRNKQFSFSRLAIRQHQITPKNIESWKKWGFEDVIGYFTKDLTTLSDTQVKIKRAITWYSKAINADSLDEQFVSLAIALESLLADKESSSLTETWGSISQKLADRVAFLLGGNYQHRSELLAGTKKLYGLRSGIVHSGKSATQEELFQVDDLVNSVIIAFLKHNFSNWDDFKDWEKQQKYIIPSDKA
jgi:Apea-like HEPN